MADCCLDCSNISDVIVDLFLGSGTSLIAAEKTKRICYGMEIEPRYVDSSVRRWVKHLKANNLEFVPKRNGVVDLKIEGKITN